MDSDSKDDNLQSNEKDYETAISKVYTVTKLLPGNAEKGEVSILKSL